MSDKDNEIVHINFNCTRATRSKLKEYADLLAMTQADFCDLIINKGLAEFEKDDEIMEAIRKVQEIKQYVE